VDLGLNDARVIVTGGAANIGRGIVHAFAREGARILVCDLDEAQADRVRIEALKLGAAQVEVLAIDLTGEAAGARVAEHAVGCWGGIDVLVNNAGFGIFAPIDQIAPEDWDRLIATNLSGVFYCCREAIPHLRNSGDAWIINIASLAGKNPFAGGAAYNASKFGLVGFSEALMLDVRQQGIRVNYIMPGSVATYFNQNEPGEKDAWKIQPEDVGQVVMDLLALPKNSLVSRVEMRPSRPPKR